MIKFGLMVVIAGVLLCSVGLCDFVLGLGIFGAVFGVVLGAIGAVFGVVAGVFGALVGLVAGLAGLAAVLAIPALIVAGIILVFRAA